LSADFYARLPARDRDSVTHNRNADRVAGAPRRTKQNTFAFPVTLVAGLVLTVVFGALLVSGVLRPPTEDQGQAVALAGTQVVLDAPYGAPRIEPSPQPSLTAQPFSGILPTPQPLVAASDQKNPPVGGAGGTMFSAPETTANTAGDQAFSALSAPVAVGPYITLTPGLLLQDGYHMCMLFNPTADAIPVYVAADAATQVIGNVAPGEQYRTLIRSKEGWYMIFVGGAGWVNPAQTYLRGNCEPEQFWVPTPTPLATPFAAQIEPLNSITMRVTVPDANQYASPAINSPLVAVLIQDQVVVAIAQTEVDGVRWIQVVPVDGLDGWVLADTVAE
jgi:hypothetical protein